MCSELRVSHGMNRGLCFTGAWLLNAFLSRFYYPRIALSASFCGLEVVSVVIKCFRGTRNTHDVIERFLTKLFGGTDIEDALRKLTPYDYGLSFEAHPRLADVDTKTRFSRFHLHMASDCRNLEVIRFLVERGVESNAKTERRSTPLHWASRRRAIEVVRFLVERGADIGAEAKT